MKNIFKGMIVSTFVLLGLSSLTFASSPSICGYEIDGDSVTYCGEEMSGADVFSFDIINEIYAKDKEHTFYEGMVITDADPDTFEIIDGFRSKDVHNIYCSDSILTDDLTNFKLYEEYSFIAVDTNYVYYLCNKFENSDPDSLIKIDGDFFKDANNIYYQGHVLDADHESFEVLGSGYAKDVNNIFFRYDGLVVGADTVSFQLKSTGSEVAPGECGGAYFDAYDDNNCYAFGKAVSARNAIVIRDKPYFNDIQKDSLDYFYEKGIFTGYEDGSFGYYKPLNRAELLKIVMFAASIDVTDSAGNCFSDVDENEWYAPYICAAKDMGYISGYPDGSFKPASFVNKVEALKMIAEVLNWDLETNLVGNVDVYNDTYEREWYFKYVINALDKFYIEMNQSGTFDPGNSITRGDAAEILYRTLVSHVIKGGEGFADADDLATSSEDFFTVHDGEKI